MHENEINCTLKSAHTGSAERTLYDEHKQNIILLSLASLNQYTSSIFTLECSLALERFPLENHCDAWQQRKRCTDALTQPKKNKIKKIQENKRDSHNNNNCTHTHTQRLNESSIVFGCAFFSFTLLRISAFHYWLFLLRFSFLCLGISTVLRFFFLRIDMMLFLIIFLWHLSVNEPTQIVTSSRTEQYK